MENPDQDQQDPRSVPGVEDTTAMTIEFLRARLLSERSVSKCARQRADELAKRVAELEEQLRVVSFQRRMAEKATADVLAILEDNGATDISETLDSNSDHETAKVEDGPVRGDANSSSIGRRNEHEEYSGSDTSPMLGASLSWKGRNDRPHIREKYKKFSIRSQSNFTSIGSSSPKHQLGRSCRQIKRRDTRPLDGEQELKSKTCVDSCQEIPSTCSEDSRNYSVNGDKISRDGYELHEKTRSGSSEVHNSVGNKDQDHDLDGYEKVSDMEKSLKCQAQLIDQYEAMEKAQREWEEKFRENNNSTPDSCDPGNHSDITEERDEIRAQAPNLPNSSLLANEPKSQVSADCVTRDLSQAQTSGGLGPSLCSDVNDLQDQNMNSVSTSRSLEEFTFPMANVKQCQESHENREQEPSCTSNLNHGLPERLLSSHTGINIYDQETPCSRTDLYALVPHEPPALDGVLEALKQAKLSLTKKINKLPFVEGGSVDKSIGALSVPKVEDSLEIPIGCAGLFRLPTDFAAEASSTQPNFLASSSELRSTARYTGESVALSATHQIFPAHEMEDRSSFLTALRSSHYHTGSGSTRDGYLTDHFPESRWKNPGQNHHFDQYFDAIQPSPYVHSYPSPPPVSSSIHPSDSFLRTFPNRTLETPPTNQYSFYEDQLRPNMYR
ncbi:uncharacterized protein LOC111445070 [Cucurbita moschata]|uniref:Uncharacterized protein LOC111445070 n=1 Tax=Cucurbita moschata TaxID=3662 RepID=A0A6J1FEU7_CUCMO|nr:uncharacterized protein LOC111445070 [Cucurbita moschata]XP_022939057.1 uncharacterized protein LOC111445070 [Cucurbita moschata]